MYTIIAGCGRVGSELARLLVTEGHNVVVIDKNPKSFDRLGGTFNGLTLVGNSFDIELLKSAGIEKADAFCALTNGDNTNLVTAQVAKKIFKVPKVITRIYDPGRAHTYKSLGLDVLSGTLLFASMLRDKIKESKLTSYLIESPEMGILEIPVSSKIANRKIGEINIPGKLIIATILKKGLSDEHNMVIPEPNTVIEEGDALMGVIKTEFLSEIRKTLGL